MSFLLPILLLLSTVMIMIAIRLIWPEFAYHWLIAAIGALAAWLIMLMAGFQLPQSLNLTSWESQGFFSVSPALLLDRLSWPYAVALATLALAVILSDVARAPESDWSAWSGSLVLAALGIFTILAENPITLLLGWTVIDLAELLVLLSQVQESRVREKVVVTFSARIFGAGLLIMAVLVTRSLGNSLSFEVIPSSASLILVLVAGLRLGVLPLHLPFIREVQLRRGLGTMARLVPAATSLVLLVRSAAATAESGEVIAWRPVILAFSGIVALYGGAAWALADDELDGRPAWILGMASFSVAGAVLGEPSASLSWGMALLLSGGLLFLTSVRDRRLIWLSGLGLLAISALPFTPTWNGARIFFGPFTLLLLPFFIAQVLFLVGYARHVLREGETMVGAERWVWLIYPLASGLLMLILFLFGWWSNPGVEDVPIAGWWVGIAAASMAGLVGIGARRRMLQVSDKFLVLFGGLLSFNWLYRFLWLSYRAVGDLIGFLTTVLEGEGGVLWALLLIVLFTLMFSGLGLGGF